MESWQAIGVVLGLLVFLAGVAEFFWCLYRRKSIRNRPFIGIAPVAGGVAFFSGMPDFAGLVAVGVGAGMTMAFLHLPKSWAK